MRNFDIAHNPMCKQYSIGCPQTFGESFYEPTKRDSTNDYIITETPEGAQVHIGMFRDIIVFRYINDGHFYDIGYYDIEEDVLVQRAVPEDDIRYKAVMYMRDIAEVIMAIRRFDRAGRKRDTFITERPSDTRREQPYEISGIEQISLFE